MLYYRGNIYLYAINEEHKLCEIIFDEETAEIVGLQQIGKETVLSGYPLTVEVDNTNISIAFPTSRKSIVSFFGELTDDHKEDKWTIDHFSI